jgi:predicted ATPase/transcriptional regulator with XRE-family HTH domain
MELSASPGADDAAFGDLLRQYRLAAGLTQEALAERSGLSVRGISDLERGARTHPQHETVKLLIAALGVSGEERAALLRAARRPLAPLRDPAAGIAQTNAFPDAPLPFTGTPLIGREETVVALAALLSDPATRLVTLLGTAGIGKTRLAVAAAEPCQASFPDGVAFVPLAPLTDPALVPGTVARALGLRESGTILGTNEIARVLGDRRVLLVLDNLEQLLPAAAPWVSQLLVACPTVTVLATSRVPLRLTVERRLPIPPLGLPATADAQIGAVWESPAVQLFVERAQAISPDFTLTAANAGDVAAVCRHLDGLPLAIELAAARVSLLAPRTLLRRLERRLPLLTGGMRDAPERHRTLRAAITWSYDLLSPEEQYLFRRLGVFVGGWTPSAAAAVGDLGDEDQVLDRLAALAERQLIVPVAGSDEPRFGMLETIREFALEQLTACDEVTATRATHAAYFASLGPDAFRHYLVKPTTLWADLALEMENLRAVLHWAKEAKERETGLWLAHLFAVLARGRGSIVEARRWVDYFLTQDANASPIALARVLNDAGRLALLQNDIDTASRIAPQLAAIAAAVPDEVTQETSRILHLMLALYRGDLSAARQHAEDGLAATRQTDPALLLDIATLESAALVAYVSGDLESMAAYWTEHHMRLPPDADRGVYASGFVGLAEVARLQGEVREALRRWIDAIGVMRGQWEDTWNLPLLIKVAQLAGEIGEPELTVQLLSAYAARRRQTGLAGFPAVGDFSGEALEEEEVLARARESLDTRSFAMAWSSGMAKQPQVLVDEAQAVFASALQCEDSRIPEIPTRSGT